MMEVAWYGELKFIENDLGNKKTSGLELARFRKKLQRIDTQVTQYRAPQLGDFDDAIGAALADHMPALALTDLSNVFGMVKFYKAARARGNPENPLDELAATAEMEPEVFIANAFTEFPKSA